MPDLQDPEKLHNRKDEMPTTEELKEAVERYAAAVSAGDRDAIVACFAVDAVFIDPYPSAPCVGRGAIAAFWDGVLAAGKPLAFVPERIAACGDRAAFNFHVILAVPDGGRIGVEGIEVATIDESGAFRELTAYWDPASIHPLPAD